MQDNFDVITTTDKDKRDEMFEDLKRNGNALERQVVKFSGVRPLVKFSGSMVGWVSTWSLAYPRTDENGNVPAARPNAEELPENLRELVEA